MAHQSGISNVAAPVRGLSTYIHACLSDPRSVSFLVPILYLHVFSCAFRALSWQHGWLNFRLHRTISIELDTCLSLTDGVVLGRSRYNISRPQHPHL